MLFFRWLISALVTIAPFYFVNAETNSTLDDLDLNALLNQRTEVHRQSNTASSISESLQDAPAALIVISAQDIRRRGYDSIDDILSDLPGFDTVVTNGTVQVVSYQRGYRTPWTQRTLFLIDGKVDNNLWMHAANFSRQYPMSNIARIEVLYGPSGAVYGPNAFLGVVNVITKQAASLADGERQVDVNLQLGSFNSQALDASLRGHHGEFGYSVGLRWFESDEPHIDDYSQWGYTDESLLSDPSYWGAGIGAAYDPVNPSLYSPLGDINVDGRVSESERVNGKALGRYSDPTNAWGMLANFHWYDWKVGVITWRLDQGFGPYYSFMDGQPNAVWFHTSDQLFVANTWQYNGRLNVSTEAVYRENSSGGDWVESFGGFVSISDWLSNNHAWRIEQQYDYQLTSSLLLTGGLKYEKKNLTKSYMICNYWDGLGYCPAQAATSSNGLTSDGSGVFDASRISSSNPSSIPPHLSRDIPEFNILKTHDTGAFIQAIYDFKQWRFNGDLRWDKNSLYGAVVNPRGAVIYHSSPTTSYKVVYGEAFQEPSPKDLYGSWNGRESNADLEPEKVKTIELIGIHQGNIFLHDVSLFYSQYDNAITSSANVGGRTIQGLEIRNRFRLQNPWNDARDITGNIFYTYTSAKADQQYDNVLDRWLEREDDQGDVAPHKINFLVNIPVEKNWNINLRANWVSERALFSQNPLRADSNSARDKNRKAESYTKVDMNILYSLSPIDVSIKVENLFEEDYLAPGVETASSGDDFSADSDGFQNSLLPQVKERVYSVNVRMEF